MTSTKRRKTTTSTVGAEPTTPEAPEKPCEDCKGEGIVYATVGHGRRAIKGHGAVCLTCMGSGTA